MLLHSAFVALHLIQPLFEDFKRWRPSSGHSVSLKFQIAVPGLYGIHHLFAVFHDKRFIEEHNRIVRCQFVGAAQIVECRGAIVFAPVADPRRK